jgi:hypothetical protein
MPNPHTNVVLRLDGAQTLLRVPAFCAGTLFCFYLDGIE